MRTILLAAMLAVVALAGCTDVDDPSTGADDGMSGGGSSAPGGDASSGGSTGGSAAESQPALGSASLYVQDAPEDHFSEVHIVFNQVLVHAAGSDGDEDEENATTNQTSDGNATSNQTADGNATANETSEPSDAMDSDDDGSWIELVNNTDGIDVDLLNVTGTRAALLGEEDLLAGKYTQIRIVVIEAYGIDHDGNRTNISLANPVLKVVKSFNVEAGMESRILVDIDLDKSLKETGPKGWKMTPVIGKTIVDIVEDASSGEDAHTVGDGTELEDIGSS